MLFVKNVPTLSRSVLPGHNHKKSLLSCPSCSAFIVSVPSNIHKNTSFKHHLFCHQLGYCNATQMGGSINDALILSMVLTHCPVSCNTCPSTPEPTTAKGATVGPCHDDDTYMLNGGFPTCAIMAKVSLVKVARFDQIL